MKSPSTVAAALGIAATLALTGCADVKTFSAAARAGDTVALALGWNLPVTRQNLQVVVSGQGGATFTFPPNDPSVRMVANFYPDPASRLIVGRETNQSLGVNANSSAQSLETQVTGNDKDYAQTMVLVNLPTTLPVGAATIQAVNTTTSATIASATVNVIGSGGSPDTFTGPGGPATPDMIRALERTDLKTVTFTGATVPYAIQLDLTYTAGIPWLVNPRGDVKSIAWSSDGVRIKVILLPANQVNPVHMSAFKFFVAGGLTGLAIDAASVKAFDASGNAVTGVTPVLN